MKHLLYPLMMMLALIVGSQTVNAQKFSSMTEEQRNDTLNKLAHSALRRTASRLPRSALLWRSQYRYMSNPK